MIANRLKIICLIGCLTPLPLASFTAAWAQQPTDQRDNQAAVRPRRLADSGSSDSLVQSTRNDLIEVIARPIPDDKLSVLLTNVGEADAKLKARLRELDSPESAREKSLTWLSRVELAVLKSELFSEGSQDGVASATEAVRIAEAALMALPAGGVARSEVLRLLAEAHLRQGDARSAAAVLRDSVRSIPASSDTDSSSESAQALRIRVAIAAEDLKSAEKMLQQVYRGDPNSARVGVGMDLAFLRYLLATENETAIADWLESIRERHGVNAKDRADTIVAQFRQQATDGIPQPATDDSDPRLWIADAMYYLRRGELMQSALHFAKAAVSDTIPSRSVDSAIKAAALLSRQSNAKAAVELLRRISQRHPQAPESAESLLQAATIAQAAGPTVATDSDVDAILLKIAKQWPETASAFAATRWRMEWAERDERWLDAARISVQFDETHWAATSRQSTSVQGNASKPDHPSVRENALQAWANAWLRLPHAEVIAAMHAELDAGNDRAFIRTIHADLTSLLADAADPRWDEFQSDTSEGFFRQLRSFRLGQSEGITESPPDGLIQALAERLELDVIATPARRVEIGRYLLTLNAEPTAASQGNSNPNVVASDLQRVAWMIWAGKREEAETRIEKELGESPQHAVAWCRRAARAYSVSPLKSDQKRAANWWKRLADGVPQGSTAWHAATIGRLRAVANSGAPDKAKASAQVIMLTTPPLTQGERKAYERLAK
ncbi:MAG: tetratricopeptide repeat protein [Rhodopirellula sp. JB055]|uniref:tetratricopeptide repeat protein n=1 Tax=Rhodopirellula sp. JB055 TaxID=3342846 RepID=UPI00370B05B8